MKVLAIIDSLGEETSKVAKQVERTRCARVELAAAAADEDKYPGIELRLVQLAPSARLTMY